MAIKDNLKLYDPQHRVPTTQNHIMNEEEIRVRALANGYAADQVEQRIQNTVMIAERSELKIQMGQALFPYYDAEESIHLLYEAHKSELISDE